MRSTIRLVAVALLLANGAAAQPLGSGEIVVTNDVPIDASENALLRVSPISGAAQPLARLELLRDPQRLAPAPDGGLYVAHGGQYVFHVDAATAAQRLVTRSLQGIADIDLATDGDLLVIQNFDQLLRLDPVTGATTLESSLSELSSPNRVAVRSASEVFVSDQGSGRVYRVVGEVQTPIPTPRTLCFEDIAWDGSSGLLFALECGGIAVWEIDPDSGRLDLVTRDLWLGIGSASPPSMIASGGDLLVTTYSHVIRIDPATGGQEVDLPMLQSFGFGDIARGRLGSYFLRFGPYVLHFDPSESSSAGGSLRLMSRTPEFSSSAPPRAVALTSDGQVLVVVGETILKVDPATRAIQIGPGLAADAGRPGGIDVESSGDVLSGRFDQILRIEQGVGGIEEFASGNNLASIRGIAREASGRVLALESDEIVRVFPDGSQSIVTRNQLLLAGDPRDIATVPGDGIYVTNGFGSDLIRVAASNSNPDTNQANVPGGADLANARGIAAEDAGTLLVAVENGSCRGVARVTPSVPSTSCFADGARFEAPFGVAVMAPEPGAAALALAACGALAACARRSRQTVA